MVTLPHATYTQTFNNSMESMWDGGQSFSSLQTAVVWVTWLMCTFFMSKVMMGSYLLGIMTYPYVQFR